MFGRKKKDNKDDKKDDAVQPSDPFMDMFEKMIKDQEEIIRSMFGDIDNNFSHSVVTRVSVGPDGKPKVEKFVNGVPVTQEESEDVEPEIVESGDKVVFTMELPGVSKDKLSVRLKNKVKLIVSTEDGFRREVSLPGSVSLISARFKNGVLSCTFHKEYVESEEEIHLD
ncbi:Hsp20/alpha crystallin family protein [Sulfuracidifex tepidarius]|uniref:ArsA HSP20-like domain-containing protein n=1 Tax=Sulfuracidifex tepidarius TaxID=1294262 RepID=A0A510E4Y2_9CREN|nr:Hsp20/alpha crystallin family protein [Sulfuracidifex tepidarius]BBG24811.1 hypothetical protein IC006_2145 [Sulfuracidifex tepidarius]BBG27595.1 hypothetical protein IC007_2149 [Sulfuracidifex tepidarius]